MSGFRKVLLTLGILLIAAGAVITVLNAGKEKKIAIDREEALAFLKERIPSAKKGLKEERATTAMPLLSCEGVDYAALFSYPRFSVELPVAAVWDTDLVRETPCRFTGSPYDGTLVIGGIDSVGQFGFFPEVDIGDTVVLTDMMGYEFTYTVSTVKHAKNSKASTMIDGRYDLTLFAKDNKSGDWLLVRCILK